MYNYIKLMECAVCDHLECVELAKSSEILSIWSLPCIGLLYIHLFMIVLAHESTVALYPAAIIIL